jgi:hypothetical protein
MSQRVVVVFSNSHDTNFASWHFFTCHNALWLFETSHNALWLFRYCHNAFWSFFSLIERFPCLSVTCTLNQWDTKARFLCRCLPHNVALQHVLFPIYTLSSVTIIPPTLRTHTALIFNRRNIILTTGNVVNQNPAAIRTIIQRLHYLNCGFHNAAHEQHMASARHCATRSISPY